MELKNNRDMAFMFDLMRREICPDLYDAVKRLHRESERPHRGHGLDHDATVAQMARVIAPTDRIGMLAWIAGLLHSLDRIVDKAKVGETLRDLLALPFGVAITPAEINLITDAVLKHDGHNDPADSEVLITLRDADRLVNTQALVVVRAGQFCPSIPAIELECMGARNPRSTFRDPQNCLDNLRSTLEWEYKPEFCLRLPRSVAIGKEYFDYIREYIIRAEQPYYALGLAGVTL